MKLRELPEVLFTCNELVGNLLLLGNDVDYKANEARCGRCEALNAML